MPIYEYACRSCGHEFEELQKISEKPLVKCPSCGNKSLVKKVSAAGFRLKGGGWYETDFKTKAKKDGDAASTESGGKNSDSSSSSAEVNKKTKDDKSSNKDKSKSTKDASSAKKTPKKES
jgi:putative FmdB family regulatory protein